MAFSIILQKNKQGTYDVKSTVPESLPDRINIAGTTDDTGQVDGVTLRVAGLLAMARRTSNKNQDV